MPATRDYLFGYDGFLYLGAQKLDKDAGTPITPFTSGMWLPANEFDFIGDLSAGGNTQEVDITTRQTARTGRTASVDTLESGTATYTIQKRLLTNDRMMTLVQAKSNKTPLAFLILCDQLTEPGSWGYAGNYTITFSDGQPVQGVQTLDVTMKLADNSYNVCVNGAGALIELPATGSLPSGA